MYSSFRRNILWFMESIALEIEKQYTSDFSSVHGIKHRIIQMAHLLYRTATTSKNRTDVCITRLRDINDRSFVLKHSFQYFAQYTRRLSSALYKGVTRATFPKTGTVPSVIDLLMRYVSSLNNLAGVLSSPAALLTFN